MEPVFGTIVDGVDGCPYFHFVRTNRYFVMVLRTTGTTEARSSAVSCMLVLAALLYEAVHAADYQHLVQVCMFV